MEGMELDVSGGGPLGSVSAGQRSLRGLLSSLIDAFEPTLRERDIVVGLDVDVGDRSLGTGMVFRLARMFDRAVQHTPPGGLIFCRTVCENGTLALMIRHSIPGLGLETETLPLV